MSIPREHGTWFMVFGPLCIGLASGPAPDALQATLLIVSVIAAFFAQNEGRAVLRKKRAASRTQFAVWATICVATAIPLLVLQPVVGLVGVVAAVIAAPQIALMLRPSRRRFDRTRTGQLLGVMLMAMTAPTGFAVAHGEVTGVAWWLWLACVAYYGSGVYVVQLLFSAARQKRPIDWPLRWELGRAHVAYHVALVAAVVVAAVEVGGTPGVLLGVAYVPALTRAFVLWLRASNTLPRLVIVGALEGIYATWFTAFVIAACQVAS